MRALHGLTTAAILATVAVLTPPAANAQSANVPADSIGIRLLEAPVARKDDPRAQTYIVDRVRPGDALTRKFEVTNGTDAAVTLPLYAVSADVTDGGWAVAEGRTSNELVEWIAVEPASLTLAPGSSATATATIRVPTSASEGERYAAVLAELPAPPETTGNVALARRVGIRVYLSVGAGGEPASDFEVSTLTPERLEDGSPVVTAQVTNTGGRALDLSGELELSDGPGGLRAGPFSADVRTLAIGDTGDVSVALDKALPAGPWKARLVMRSGRIEKAVEATLTFPDGAGQKSAPATAKEVPLAKDIDVVGPVAVGVLGLVSLMLLFAIWWLRRHRKKDDDEDGQPTPALPVQRRAADEQVSP